MENGHGLDRQSVLCLYYYYHYNFFAVLPIDNVIFYLGNTVYSVSKKLYFAIINVQRCFHTKLNWYSTKLKLLNALSKVVPYISIKFPLFYYSHLHDFQTSSHNEKIITGLPTDNALSIVENFFYVFKPCAIISNPLRVCNV